MQLPIIGSLVQVEKTLNSQVLDNILGYEGSGNLGLTFDKRDTTFDGYVLSFFYKTETSGARPLEFDVESNTIVLPPQMFTYKGKVYIGLLGTKQVDDKLVQITTSPARLRVRETVDPNDLDGMPTESEWMEVVNQMVNQLSKDLDGRITKLEQEGTGGGTKDHSKLINRDAENSHPLSAITGLVSALAEKLEKSKLGEAITQALAQAKASGEFNGKDGISPTMSVSQAENGTTFTVTDVNGQKSATIKNGVDGKTPVKGEDYFTEADKQEMVDTLIPRIPTKLSELENDAKYLTEHQDISHLANKNELPKKTSDLTNDSGFLTEHQSLEHLATKQELPTKLPTPHLLTFTGAVSGSWDGSSPLEVNIPKVQEGEVIDVDAELKQYMTEVKPAIVSAINEKGGNASIQDAYGTFPQKIKAIPNGVAPAETLPKQTTLTAIEAVGGIELKWLDTKASGYALVRSQTSVPKTPSDGTEVYRGTQLKYLDKVQKGNKYYYRIFPYNFKNQYQTIEENSVVEIFYQDRTGQKQLKDLRVNDEIVMGEKNGQPIVWQLKDSARTSETGLVVFATKSSVIGNYPFDAPENDESKPNPNGQRKSYGNNRWSLSNARQFLNSDGLKNEWWRPTHEYDAKPNYANQDGFMRCFDDFEKGIIIAKENKSFLPDADGAGFETSLDKLWLIGSFEAGLDTKYVDGDHIFNGMETNEQRAFEANYWTRSINANDNPAYARYVSAAGSWNSINCNNYSALRPFCQLSAATNCAWSELRHAYILVDDSQRYPEGV